MATTQIMIAGFGGPVLVGGLFAGAYQPSPEDDRRCQAYIREKYAFTPTLIFDGGTGAGTGQDGAERLAVEPDRVLRHGHPLHSARRA